MKKCIMNSISPYWVGFNNIQKMSPQFSTNDYDVLCLPENIETFSTTDKLIETFESIQICKTLKSHGIQVKSLYDYGIEIPLYDRRCNDQYLGIILIKDVALPIVLGVLSNWISNKLLNSTIHLKLKIQKPEEIISIDYNGDEKTLKQIIDSLTRSENDEH
jgi:hypothetical protein